MSLVTWNDAYHDLWMQAAQSRGTVTATGGLAGASWPMTLPEWPRTTGADAIAIAAVIDPILSAMSPCAGISAVTRLWQRAIVDLDRAAVPSPSLEYAHNRTFWSTVLTVAAYLSTFAAPVPSDEIWDALEAVLWSPAIEHRNATAPSNRTLTASTYSGMWETLRAELARARGSDLRDDELGGIIEVPRTANGDALQLEAYWSRALVQLQLRVMTGAMPTPENFEDVQLEWQAVSAGIAYDGVLGRAADSYPANLELWRATRALALALELLEVRPGPYVLIDAPTPAAAAAPWGGPASARAPAATPKATDLSSRLSNFVDDAVNAMAHAFNDASHKLVTTVGRPLLFTGAAVATLLLILKATEPCNCAPEPEPGLSPEPSAATAVE
jgi:hypothetical protein